jgi:hypothetical protein
MSPGFDLKAEPSSFTSLRRSPDARDSNKHRVCLTTTRGYGAGRALRWVAVWIRVTDCCIGATRFDAKWFSPRIRCATIFRMIASQPRRSRGLATALFAIAAFAAALPGCAVVTVASTVASAAVTVGGAAVSVGTTVVGTGVKVAGKVVEKTIDVATPGK